MAQLIWTFGYSKLELERAQERFGLTFPPDLIDLLLDRRLSNGPDWNSEHDILPRLAWPYEGLLFDVEQNDLWWEEWGEKPDNPNARAEVLRGIVARAPTLIPLFSHRYLPATPSESGNPVFSVYQADIIHYGADLEDYFEREENGWDGLPWPEEVKEIEFWSELVRRNPVLNEPDGRTFFQR